MPVMNVSVENCEVIETVSYILEAKGKLLPAHWTVLISKKSYTAWGRYEAVWPSMFLW